MRGAKNKTKIKALYGEVDRLQTYLAHVPILGGHTHTGEL